VPQLGVLQLRSNDAVAGWEYSYVFHDDPESVGCGTVGDVESGTGCGSTPAIGIGSAANNPTPAANMLKVSSHFMASTPNLPSGTIARRAG